LTLQAISHSTGLKNVGEIFKKLFQCIDFKTGRRQSKARFVNYQQLYELNDRYQNYQYKVQATPETESTSMQQNTDCASDANEQ
jgi:hypothetical protein